MVKCAFGEVDFHTDLPGSTCDVLRCNMYAVECGDFSASRYNTL